MKYVVKTEMFVQRDLIAIILNCICDLIKKIGVLNQYQQKSFSIGKAKKQNNIVYIFVYFFVTKLPLY